MSLTNLDLFSGTREGLNYSQTHALVGKLLRGTNEQAVAASLASSPINHCAPLQQDSGSPDISFISSTLAAAAAESMTIDVIRVRNGAASSILTGVYTYDHSKPVASLISLNGLIDPAKMPLLTGDVLQVTRVLANGATMTNNSVIVEPRPTVVIPNGGGAV